MTVATKMIKSSSLENIVPSILHCNVIELYKSCFIFSDTETNMQAHDISWNVSIFITLGRMIELPISFSGFDHIYSLSLKYEV